MSCNLNLVTYLTGQIHIKVVKKAEFFYDVLQSLNYFTQKKYSQNMRPILLNIFDVFGKSLKSNKASTLILNDKSLQKKKNGDSFISFETEKA